MTKRMKVYLPGWARWALIPALIAIWGLLTYQTFWSAPSVGRLGVGEWGVLSAVLIALMVFLVLASSGRLPLHEIRTEDDEDQRRPPRG